MIGRIPILDIQPVVACGRRPAKAVTGETLPVSATVFREGHEMLGAGVVLRDPAGNCLPIVTMRELAAGSDRYVADVTPAGEGLWHFQVQAWGDPIAHWRHDAAIKVPIGQDVELMLEEGALLFERAARELAPAGQEPAPGGSSGTAAGAATARARYKKVARTLRGGKGSPVDRLGSAFTAEVTRTLAASPLRELTTCSPWRPLLVHRQRALYGSWYEFVPRSEGARVDPLGRRVPVSGTLRTAARRLGDIAAMGFDVVYLPPVHPIGTTA
ncbi:MAG TPA: maltotransferase domain-containing protein, partial [Streptosporangiaceae bacterium]